MNDMEFKRSKVDPCLYYNWSKLGLVLIVSWVDDLLVAGHKDAVMNVKKQILAHFECDDVGELTEYVGCLVERDKDCIRMTQPVMLQSFRDEFELPEGNDNPITPAVAGEVLQPCDPEHQLADKEQVIYRQGVGKLLHLMRWSRPDVLNSVRELTRFAGRASMAHMKAMYRVMKFCRATKKRGKTLKPRRNWDETKDYEFEILGRSDSDYAKDPIG
jgi:hypothetical protein